MYAYETYIHCLSEISIDVGSRGVRLPGRKREGPVTLGRPEGRVENLQDRPNAVAGRYSDRAGEGGRDEHHQEELRSRPCCPQEWRPRYHGKG